MGATGPELAYTLVFYETHMSLDIGFMAARFWRGMWCAEISRVCGDLRGDLQRHLPHYMSDWVDGFKGDKLQKTRTNRGPVNTGPEPENPNPHDACTHRVLLLRCSFVAFLLARPCETLSL